MYSLIKRDDEVCYNVNEYLCDTEEDVKSLPPHCAPGSVAIVLEEQYICEKELNKEVMYEIFR
jgi:hypothetical protein